MARNLVQFTLGSLYGLHWLESPRHRKNVIAFSRRENKRNQQICRGKEIELWRQNPDDSVAPIIERHCLPDDLRILAKAVFPETVADQYDLLVTRLELFGGEGATRLWRDAEQGQKLSGNPL